MQSLPRRGCVSVAPRPTQPRWGRGSFVYPSTQGRSPSRPTLGLEDKTPLGYGRAAAWIENNGGAGVWRSHGQDKGPSPLGVCASHGPG